jgi:spore germination cell wall hydrolase CwlJ-like protein
MQAKMKESWKTRQHSHLQDSERVYYPIRNMCQFSWYCDGRADVVADGDSWRRAQTIAYMMVEHNKYRGITEGATHYHADYVSPKWAPELDLVGSIGMHIFYRWP